MDKTNIIDNNVEDEVVEQEVVENTTSSEEDVATDNNVELVESEEVETLEDNEESTEDSEENRSYRRRRPRRFYRDPQFGWESLDSIQSQRKHELIQEVFDLQGEDNEEKIEEIVEEWEEIHDEGTDKSLEERFERALERHTATQEAMDESIKIKEDLIKKAEEMKESTRWNKTANKYKALQEEWKDSGWAGEEDNERLWKEFQEVNDYFFTRRKEHFAERSERIKEAEEIKTNLITHIEQFVDSTDWKNTSAIMHKAMDDWKAAGFAGRGVDDKLWEQFNNIRQGFFQRQNEYFENLRLDQKKSQELKSELIEKVESLKDSTDFENTRIEMENLMDQWRNAGYSGKKHDNKLWEAFQAARDVFYKNFHSQLNENKFDRVEEVENELENINAQIDSLELLNETIIAKYDSVLNRALPSEDNENYDKLFDEKEAELSELQGYIDNNNKSINEHFDTLDRLNRELSKLK